MFSPSNLFGEPPKEEKKTCGFGTRCIKADCRFGHPKGYSLSGARSQYPCRNEADCTNIKCGFKHPKDWQSERRPRRRAGYNPQQQQQPSAESSRPGTPPLVAEVDPDENTEYAQWLKKDSSLTHALLTSLATKLGLELKSGVSLCFVRAQLLRQLHPDKKHYSGMTDVCKDIPQSVRNALLQRVIDSK
jgi:hypothetical protein